MSRFRIALTIAVLLGAIAGPAQSAMYKWVDEKGNTNYGDRVPPQYADRAGDQNRKPGRTAKADAKAVEQRPAEQDLEKQKLEAKQRVERQRQDSALLATYSSENEIEQARDRELRRNADILKHTTAGLAKSNSREDKQKLDALIDQSRSETDAINAKYDGYKARYRELAQAQAATQTAQSGQAGSR